jgi:hypothetical protein
VSLTTLLIIVLVVWLVFSLPTWPYSANWGAGPSGVAGIILIVLLLLLLTGRI